jgi:hypothetical protein
MPHAISSSARPIDMSSCNLSLRRLARRISVSATNGRVLIPIAFAICACASWGFVSKQPRTANIRLGFVNLGTTKESGPSPAPESYLGGVLVRFFDDSTKRESFAMTNDTGVALVPLRPGHYCAEAYGTDVRRLKLATRMNHGEPVCFEILANTIKEVGVTLASDGNYKPNLPPAGVE